MYVLYKSRIKLWGIEMLFEWYLQRFVIWLGEYVAESTTVMYKDPRIHVLRKSETNVKAADYISNPIKYWHFENAARFNCPPSG